MSDVICLDIGDGNFSTKDQAMATAFAMCSIGDEIEEHFEECRSGAQENCTCESVIWRFTESGWHVEAASEAETA